jgi:hypothetical protein
MSVVASTTMRGVSCGCLILDLTVEQSMIEALVRNIDAAANVQLQD